MKITVEGQTYEYDGRLMASEARQLKAYTGMTLSQFVKAGEAEDIDALVFLVWLCKRRAGEQVKFSEVDFDITTMEIEQDDVDDDAERPTGESPATPSGSPTTSESTPGTSNA